MAEINGAEWDLTPALAPNLDPQLVIGLLEFLDNQKVSFVVLLLATKMVINKALFIFCIRSILLNKF